MASTSHNPTPPPTLWDVFLSFRGKDTRYSFTDHLYKALQRTAIRTFRDDPELLSGEVISRALPQAIHESKTYIVVFSENYATSSWCLEELEEILSCCKGMKRLVIPVFYKIDPSVVRYQIESFQQAFGKHQTRYDSDKVNKWRLTLNEVAGFSGYHISENRSEADLIDQVVGRVLLEVNPITLDVARYPVGLDSRVKDVTELFNSITEGVIKIGIHGMGGVGKTTLAKAMYNLNYRQFSGSCFLANVREVSRTKGLACLQQQLITDVLKCKGVNIDNVDQGIELIRARICSTKVLVVIDDLDDPKLLRYLVGSFASGSMVIITTRNEDLLDRIKVEAKYKVNEMDKDESRQLFNQHAFGEDKISDTFTELSEEILELAGGLPLALQVFGSTLLNESKEGWRWFIDKLKQASIDDVEENLMISFDALKSVDPYLQNIFLDIACFFIGKKEDRVFRIMETCYTHVPRNIDILKKRCLITVDGFGNLGMHDLLRDMGRKSARNNCPDEPGRHSRLWVSKEIETVLKNNKGTEAIQGIIYDKFYYEEVTAESFRRMSNLRFLHLNNVNLTGSFEQTFKDLRWLCWEHCPQKCLPFEFNPEKLVVLELPNSKMKAMWERNMVCTLSTRLLHGNLHKKVSRIFKNLKTLNMRNSPNLTTTPDFTSLPSLETLDLQCCVSLEEVHESIGSLVSLVSLDLTGYNKLRSLPDSICRLRALEVLKIDYCRRLDALPTELGKIKSLKVLHALELSVSKLPDSIGRLSNLVELRLSRNRNLETLLESICKLRSLKLLDIQECEKLAELPDQLGMITSLRELYLMGATMLKKIPDISPLSNIQDLDLSDCIHLLSIGELPPNLKQIKAENCRSLKRIPDLSNLKQLAELNLGRCNVLTEIRGLEELTHLRKLVLEYCDRLHSLSELPPNLKQISAGGCTSLKRLPNLSNLKHLEELDLTNCYELMEIQGLDKLTSLKQLVLAGCNSSLQTSTLTKRFFQILSGFGQKVAIYVHLFEFPGWMSQSSNVRGSRMSFDLQPNASHKLMGIIFCSYTGGRVVTYSIKNMRSGFKRSDKIDYRHGFGSLIVIIPSSILSIGDGQSRLEIKSDREIQCGIHLLYKTEIKMIREHNSTIVQDERSNPSGNDLESNKKWLTRSNQFQTFQLVFSQSDSL